MPPRVDAGFIGPRTRDEADFPLSPNEHGYAFPTWEAALRDAAEGVGAAYDCRRRTFVAAHAAGLSYATIGKAVGLSAQGVWKIIGGDKKQPTQDELLRSPAGDPDSGSEADNQ